MYSWPLRNRRSFNPFLTGVHREAGKDVVLVRCMDKQTHGRRLGKVVSWFGGKGLQFISGWAQSSQQAALHYTPALRALWFNAGQGIVSSATHILEM